MESRRSEMSIINEIFKQTVSFNYFGYSVCYEGEQNLNVYTVSLGKVLGILSIGLSPHLVRQQYHMVAKCTIRRTGERTLSVEMHFMTSGDVTFQTAKETNRLRDK
jgi:hypothetical protein